MTGELISYQASFCRTGAFHASHAIDFHWRINNSEVIASVFSFDDLWSRSAPLPDAPDSARRLGDADMLLLACIHRETHRVNPYYFEGIGASAHDRLIWLHDIALIAQGFDQAAWKQLVRHARQHRVAKVLADGLEASQTPLDAPVQAWVIEALRENSRPEKVWTYLHAPRWRQGWLDWLALGTAGKRMRLLFELAFPPEDYMRHQYGSSQSPLPWLHARRIIEGGFARLRAMATAGAAH
jgi:hypothetical protein